MRYVDVGEAQFDAAAGVDADPPRVLGGPIGVYATDKKPFLGPECKLIRRRLAARRPTPGICPGAQLMARALHARVACPGVSEIGFAPLTLTAEGQV